MFARRYGACVLGIVERGMVDTIKKLLEHLGEYRRPALIAPLCTLIAVGMEVLIPYVMALLIDRMSDAPRRRFGIPAGEDFTIWDLNRDYAIDPAEFLSLGRATPFAGRQVFGRCMLTVCDGKAVYLEEN